jgi:hypothetical protein
VNDETNSISPGEGHKLRKCVGFLMVTLLLVFFALPIMAATDVNVNEQAVLTRFGAGCVVTDHTVTPSLDDQNMARNFFLMDGVDFTASDASVIITALDAICVVIADQEVNEADELPLDEIADKQEILTLAQNAAVDVESIDITFEYDFETGFASILGANAEVMISSEISTTSTTVKNTGYDGDATIWLISILTLSMGTGIVLAKKKHLLTRKS